MCGKERGFKNNLAPMGFQQNVTLLANYFSGSFLVKITVITFYIKKNIFTFAIIFVLNLSLKNVQTIQANILSAVFVETI